MRARTRRVIGTAATLAATVALALPTAAGATLLGGGEVVLTAQFSPGIQPLPAGCQAQSLTLNGNSQAAAFSVNGASLPGYVGPLDIGGAGSTQCADLSHESGTVTLAVTGASGLTQNSVSCPAMSGGYVRVGPAVIASLAGSCTLSGQTEPIVSLIATGAFKPTSGDGVSSTITAASFTGAFSFAP
jgi:hypothetical protein